jgi:hypothetical protein
MDLIPPQPNLNGNTEKSLLDQLKVVMHNLEHVTESMSKANDCWHGRNFLPQGSPEARIMRDLAQDAWSLRFDVIKTMKEEILTLALQIQGGESPKLPEPPAVIVLDNFDAGVPTDIPTGWEEVEGGAKTMDEWEQMEIAVTDAMEATPADTEFVEIDEASAAEIDAAVTSIMKKLDERND